MRNTVGGTVWHSTSECLRQATCAYHFVLLTVDRYCTYSPLLCFYKTLQYLLNNNNIELLQHRSKKENKRKGEEEYIMYRVRCCCRSRPLLLFLSSPLRASIIPSIYLSIL